MKGNKIHLCINRLCIPGNCNDITSQVKGLKISQDVQEDLHVDDDIKEEWER